MADPNIPQLRPGATIGILGGGQLGRMLAMAAARLGLHCHIYCPDKESPAFDVVPNAVETPRFLSMQIGAGRTDISREALLADAVRFGFDSHEDAAQCLDALLQRIRASFMKIEILLADGLRDLMRRRLADRIEMLTRSAR